MSNSRRLLLPLVVLLTGLSFTSILQLPKAAHSQQDYEELIITETNNDQKLNQKNIGSESSNNLNCGTNVIESTSTSTTCPTMPGETIPTPGTTVIPVVTQRMTEIPVVPSGTTSGEAECNPDEVVTGGGYEITEVVSSGGGGGIIQPGFKTFKEFAVDNSWHVEISGSTQPRTVIVYAECLKLVPA